MITRFASILALACTVSLPLSPALHAEPGEIARCHVLPAWSAHLNKEVTVVRTKYPADSARLCSVSSMADHQPGTRFSLATVMEMHGACARGTKDCGYVASQMAFLIERVFLMRSYAQRHGCAMPHVPHPCHVHAASLQSPF